MLPYNVTLPDRAARKQVFPSFILFTYQLFLQIISNEKHIVANGIVIVCDSDFKLKPTGHLD